MTQLNFSNALFTDLYELTMAQAYWRQNMHARATFSLFFRGYPGHRSFYAAAGIESALGYLESFHFTNPDLQHLAATSDFDASFLEHLAKLRFTGDVRAVPEGSLTFAGEPVVEVTAPIIQAQLVETYLLNQVTFQTTLLTKAVRVHQAAQNRSVVDFSARRTHGEEAAGIAARCGWIAGFAGTSNMRAAAIYDIPAVGTMAHSFVQAFDHELDAFRAYSEEFPRSTTLLVDTYDTARGVQNAITVANEMEERGERLQAIRIDSGDFASETERARQALDDAGLKYVRIVVSGGLDEYAIADLLAEGAPVDSFGVGTRFGVSSDAPHADSAYKLVEYGGRPSLKTSEGKATLPGPKQVHRFSVSGYYTGDMISTVDETAPEGSEPLLRTVMKDGKRLEQTEPLEKARHRLSEQLARLPARNRHLRHPAHYPVTVSHKLQALRDREALARRSQQ